MNETLEFLIRHSTTVLFAAVFVEQIGVPPPAARWLLASGCWPFDRAGKMNWFVALSAATVGSVMADLIWFYFGRYRGQRVLNLLCRIALDPSPHWAVKHELPSVTLTHWPTQIQRTCLPKSRVASTHGFGLLKPIPKQPNMNVNARHRLYASGSL